MPLSPEERAKNPQYAAIFTLMILGFMAAVIWASSYLEGKHPVPQRHTASKGRSKGA